MLFKTELERTRELVQAPDWYLAYGKVQRARVLGLGAVQAALGGQVTDMRDEMRSVQLDIFEQLLSEGSVALGEKTDEGLDIHDEHRAPIDHIMIHHSKQANGISLPRLNAMHLLRLYVPRYQDRERPIMYEGTNRHQPIYSAHFNSDGQQVFYGYHWKIEQDGSYERLLEDSAVGWHAGNWDMNTRSVALVIDDDLSSKGPTAESLEAAEEIIRNNYSDVGITAKTLLGHHATFKTACPGQTFEEGWKQTLLKRLHSA